MNQSRSIHLIWQYAESAFTYNTTHVTPTMDTPVQPHVIRIHAAWTRTEYHDETLLRVSTKISLPDQHAILPSANALLYRRNFNRPTSLNSSCKIFLETELLAVADEVMLNERRIGEIVDENTVDITTMLMPHNSLCIKIAAIEFHCASLASAKLLLYES